MNFIKKILGFNSEYSWTKWLRMAFAFVAFIIASAFWSNFGPLVMGGGIIGVLIALIIFAVLFGPILLVMLGIAGLVGTVIGGTLSGVKQRKSFKETVATGSAELLELEKLRLKSQVLDFLLIITAIALVALGVVLMLPLDEAFGEAGIYGYMILAVIVLGGFSLAKAPVNKRYERAFKEQIVTKGLESVLGNMNFRPEEKLEEALVKASGLFPKYDVYSGNDYLEADYQGHSFIQSDIRLHEEREETYRDSDGDWHTRKVYVTVFLGRLMVFDYDAISNEPVYVYDRHGGKPKITEAIQTELDSFNRKFHIVASSPTDALRILTPPVLEGIVMAAEKTGYPLYLSFREDKLYVALANGDTFEAAGGDATLSEQRQRVTKDIKAMLELVNTLYLKDQPQKGGINT